MIHPHPAGHYAALTRRLCQLPEKTEWVNFKGDCSIPQDIGRHISALSNSAACNSKPSGYIFWGMENGAQRITGTTFHPETERVDKEPLETWLQRRLEPQIQFDFHSMNLDGKRVVMLEVECAPNQPVSFGGTEYIRHEETAKPLRNAPGRERELWRAIDRRQFTELSAAELLDGEEVLRLLSYSAYFELLELPAPKDCRSVLKALARDDLIRSRSTARWDITNLGALVLAKSFESFPNVRGKDICIIRYRGTDRTRTTKGYANSRGYAGGLADLTDHVATLLLWHKAAKGPGRKKIRTALVATMRELIVNALIHQDFAASHTGPTLEIFADRIEVANPGEPLAGADHFLGAPPRSRNESLAYLMRRFGYCEEWGSGIARAIKRMAEVQLPAPRFEVRNGFTHGIVFLRQVGMP